MAFGEYSHVEGFRVHTIGDRAHAEGDIEEDSNTYNRIVEYKDAEGNLATKTSNSFANGAFSHREGRNTATFGNGSHAEGQGSMTIGSAAHAEGYNTTAVHTGAHSEGHTTQAEGEGAHTEGCLTVANGKGAHAEGSATHAEGEGAHAEGYDTWAQMACAHTEGKGTRAEAKYSHASGLYTTATTEAQTVVGSYNALDNTAKFVVGVGTEGNRANAFTAGNDGTNDYITVGTEKLTESDVAFIKSSSSVALTREIVSELPSVENAKENVIYMINQQIIPFTRLNDGELYCCSFYGEPDQKYFIYFGIGAPEDGSSIGYYDGVNYYPLVLFNDDNVDAHLGDDGHWHYFYEFYTSASSNANTEYRVYTDLEVRDITISIEGDAYKEYMLIGGKLQQIGDTSVNLSDYIKTENGKTIIGSYAEEDAQDVFVIGNGTGADHRANLFTVGVDSNGIPYMTLGGVKITLDNGEEY